MSAKSTIAARTDDVVSVQELMKGRSKSIPAVKKMDPKGKHGPAKTIAVVNQKGGVGKTTTTISLGASLAELGRRVLLVDFDPQGSLSIGLGVVTDELESSIYNLLMDRNARVDDVLLKTSVPGMDLIPSDIMLSGAEIGLVNEVAREQTLKRILASVAPDYDVILIDCQPSLGLLTVNALTAADLVLVPLQCEYFALRGFKLLKEITSKIQERLNPDLKIIGIVATMFERTAHSKEVLSRIYEAFPEQVFDTVISKTVRFNETTAAGEPITNYASSSTGAAAYRRLAREVIARGGTA